ncbi:nuclear transport factor 2 family protein [Rudaea sp.]|uniref:nuclear transport factor 2 family protein n=1 Tax=Rudaea sp. TaxID=2136325 RepID=UPI002ED29675
MNSALPASRYRLAIAVSLLGLAGTPALAVESDCGAMQTAQQKKDEDTIRRIEQGWLEAEYRGNPKFLECLLEPDYRTSSRSGKVRSKKEVVDRVAQLTDMTREVPKLETIVVIHGDAATAHSILRSTDKEGKPKEVHFVDGYTFRDGSWHAFSGADL